MISDNFNEIRVTRRTSDLVSRITRNIFEIVSNIIRTCFKDGQCYSNIIRVDAEHTGVHDNLYVTSRKGFPTQVNNKVIHEASQKTIQRNLAISTSVIPHSYWGYDHRMSKSRIRFVT